MFGLKTFVRVQTFRRVPPVLPCNFCHPDPYLSPKSLRLRLISNGLRPHLYISAIWYKNWFQLICWHFWRWTLYAGTCLRFEQSHNWNQVISAQVSVHTPQIIQNRDQVDSSRLALDASVVVLFMSYQLNFLLFEVHHPQSHVNGKNMFPFLSFN